MHNVHSLSYCICKSAQIVTVWHILFISSSLESFFCVRESCLFVLLIRKLVLICRYKPNILLNGKSTVQRHLIPTLASTPFHSLTNTSLRSLPDQHSFRHTIWTCCFPSSWFLLRHIHYSPWLHLLTSRIPTPWDYVSGSCPSNSTGTAWKCIYLVFLQSRQ